MEEDIGDIGDIGCEHSLSNLSAKQEKAIEMLYADPKMEKFLGSLAYRFRQGDDANDVRQNLALMIIKADPASLEDVKSLRSWLITSAKNLCLNGYRHNQVVNKHSEKCLDENTRGKMRGGAVVLQCPTVKTPEQQVQEREQEEQLEERLQGFIESLPRDTQVVARMWSEGKSPADIAKAIGKSEQTVYRHHKYFERALVKRCLDGGKEPDKKLLREVVDDLSRLACVA